MTKRFLLMLATTLLSLCAVAQSEFYVVFKDGSAQRYLSEKVDSLTFKNPEEGMVVSFGEMLKMIDVLKSELDSLKEVAANCGKDNGANTTHAYVDLGLPSGTLWATRNVGAAKPEEYGDYFAWGESRTKATYTQFNSETWGVAYSDLKSQGVIDENGTGTWGDSRDWRMPTREEIEELISLENKEAKVNGVSGRLFIGSNGNTLFLPYAGYRYYDELRYAGEGGYYWSSTVSEDAGGAYRLYVASKNTGLNDTYRYYGFTVRKVLRIK